MRVIVMVKETERSEAGVLPSQQLVEDMGKFNEDLVAAGIMVAGEGLLPSRKGKRLVFSAGGASKIVDGPFAEAKELVGGFWIWKVDSMEQALEWAAKMPCPHDLHGSEESIVEIRQIAEPEDYGDLLSPELADREREMRARYEESQRQ